MTSFHRTVLEQVRDYGSGEYDHDDLAEAITAVLADHNHLLEACEAALADMNGDEVALAEPAYSMVAAAIAAARGETVPGN